MPVTTFTERSGLVVWTCPGCGHEHTGSWAECEELPTRKCVWCKTEMALDRDALFEWWLWNREGRR